MAKSSLLRLSVAGALAAAACASISLTQLNADAEAPPPPPQLTFIFDAVFGDNMVLQQAPSQAAVYGFLPWGSGSGVSVSVQLLDGSTNNPIATSQASINATQQPFGNGWGTRPCPKAVCPPYDMNTFTPWPEPLPTWKALLPPQAAGGNYTIHVSCTGCTGNVTDLYLYSVTFGDVWYCTGQSNMWLPVLHTFSRNESAGNISAGLLSNIRLMAGSSGSVPYASWPPNYGKTGGTNQWMTAEQAAPEGCVDKQNCPFFQVGATCWYFAQGLVQQGAVSSSTPIGILNTAIGGQRIEEYMENTTINQCTDRSGENIPWWDGQLYGQQVLMFVDMTLKGFLWLQGENNMGGVKGNALAGVGYGCEMQVLINAWRAKWSATPNTTDPMAPFGLVTLASSGSEGGPNMGAMRWAQTANYGILPSPALPNTFFARSDDLDDPWGPESGPCFSGAGNWACCAPNYNQTTCNGRETLCAPACAAQADTTPVMGGIHPRNKKPVGDRLATAAANVVYGGSAAYTGPTLSGCSASGNALTVRFNTTLLRGDSVVVRTPFPAYIPPSRYLPLGTGGSQLWVQTNASLFCMEPQCVANATTGACIQKPAQQYCPTWAGGDGTTVYPNGALDSGWVLVNYTLVPSTSSSSEKGEDGTTAGGTAISVDLTPLGGLAPTAIRYAWGIIDCCDHTDPTLYVTHGCEASCPIVSSSGLPANGFQARIVSGKCSCVAPQTCDE